MRRFFLSALTGLALVSLAPAASADVRVHIDRGSQTMRVYVNGSLHDEWPVSTGRRGYATPGGTFRAQRLAKRWYSSKYNNTPMHNAIFFHGGYAIHATSYVSQLGRPASHGCVRLHPSHAAELYGLVEAYGRGRTRITITR